ncbi:xanthine dehydrogenase [Hylaeus anthracinus]|uniref:xanthine dehydrogenase n=1 Tax=Hylaeus anthracinus TaxID=313031 RepID=UPI0023B9B0F1|nr:xanthine dehydrogenase [Hylaeus anthracinus]
MSKNVGNTEVSHTLIFYVNGKEVVDDNVNPEWTLLWYLRDKLHLTGTKLGCAEGGCGACTVMISRVDRKTGIITHLAANACLTPICAVHGMAVTTVEGIGSVKTKIHPVQERIAKAHGSQCGFCTPGIVMSMYALLRSTQKPTMKDLEIAFQGNLCRCTGYRPIIEAYKTFTEEWEQLQLMSNQRENSLPNGFCPMGENCCKKVQIAEPSEVFNSSEFSPYDASQEIIFPPNLLISSTLDDQYLIIKGKNVTWYRPRTLSELLSLKEQYPHAKIVMGNTEMGVEVKFKHLSYPVLIHPILIKEMRVVEECPGMLSVGASVTLVELEKALREQMNKKTEHETRIFSEIVNMLHWFAGKQVRNVAAVGGNIMTGSPIADLSPIFMAGEIKLNLINSKSEKRLIPMDHTFFKGYRQNIVSPDEILLSVQIPFSKQHQYFIAYKQARRRDDDITIVNMALNVFFEPGANDVQKAYLAFGGMAPTTVLARKTCETMIGRKWNKMLLEDVYSSLLNELPLPESVPGGMVKYRKSLTLSLFFKAFMHIAGERQILLESPLSLKEFESTSDVFHYKEPQSSQYYQEVPRDQEKIDLIGRPVVHASAFKQATGEAIYCDDLHKFSEELYLTLVLSTRAHAKIVKIDATKALSLEGVVAFFSAKDVPEKQRYHGPVFHDEEFFVSEEVTSHGQVIGAIIAVNQFISQRAARMVEVEYENLEPVIISIEDAIKHRSFFNETPKRIRKGDADEAFSRSTNILEGEVRLGGQEHFYLETQAALAIPREDELEIFCSTQHPTEIQKHVAHALNIHANKVVIRVKRLGGGFGGKESRASVLALPVAFAAHRLRKPVRCMLDRDEDMMISGTRHPFYFKYKVGFDGTGLIKVLQVFIYNNAGYSRDLSFAVLERAMFHVENAYKIPVCDVNGFVCKTNLPSNTAFRGFGGPQGMFAVETIIRHIAEYLNIEPAKVSELNLYREGDTTHYNQKLINCTIRRCWEECLLTANYNERLAEIQKYNRINRYKKRGLAVVPTKFGIAFTVLFLNQSGALVHVYTDGSVLLSHGGVEMGQGLHTKMIQVASKVLKINADKIHIMETATDKVPNTSPTAASAGSDLNGMAVLNACQEIMKRLKPVMDKNPTGTWEEWVATAYNERISLSSTGFYKTPDIGYSFETNSGNPFNYFTYGVACSEVEIDCLTGDHCVVQTDIVMDLGQSLNPAIDIGQIEGGFVQGYGLFTLEEMVYLRNGVVFSRGPGAYKLPGFADIPEVFNVTLLKGASNPRAVYSSKAVGEPPLFLASSVFFAIREAIKSARQEYGLNGYFRFDSPATSARIRLACVDDLTSKIKDADLSCQWNVVP